MINEALKYLQADGAERAEIFNYYNANCYPKVSAERKYKMKLGDNWCACFVSVVAMKSGIKNGFPFEVSCYYMLKGAQLNDMDFYNVEGARRGDIVFFDWDSDCVPDHVGFVIAVEDGCMRTIEGNHNGTVAFREMVTESKFIQAFMRPPVHNETDQDATIDAMAKAVIRGKYGIGDDRRDALGRDYKRVQDRVNELLKR